MNKLSGMTKAKKPIIGILGGMCSGKSTAAAEFARMGCAVIDADEIAHQLLDDDKTKAKIAGLFGKGVLDSDGPSTSLRTGKISREKLAKIVFDDAGKLLSLTSVLHPEVLARVEELIARHTSEPKVKAIVLDMPLLVEVGWKKRCDYIIFIDCKPSERLKRAQKTGFFDAEGLKKRENLQISLDKKKRIADNIVNNNSDLSSLSKQIASIFSSIMDKR
jgi:dephospho-CoA kinase